MRLILFIILLFSFSAQGQIINASQPYRPFAVAAAQNLLLDDYPGDGVSYAYSLRKTRAGYTGSAIRVRRSNDNSEQDIGFTANGDLDTASLKTFVGANSGFVTTWYDQSDRLTPNNATQTTAANQPRIVNAGVVDRENGKVIIVFDGSNDHLFNTAGNWAVGTGTLLAVSSRRNSAAVNRVIFSTGILVNLRGYGFLYNTADSLRAQVRYVAGTPYSWGTQANTINTTNLMFGVITPTESNSWVNGGNNANVTYSAQTPTTSSTVLCIGCRFNIATSSSPGLYLNGTISEIVVWGSTDQTLNRNGIETNINSYYGIY